MTIDDYMKLSYPMEIYEDTIEGGYTVSFPDLPGCLTCGETIQEAIEMAKDAKRAWLEAAIEDGYNIKLPDSEENYSGEFLLKLPKSLHRILAQNAKKEGIDINQYCIYILSRNNALFS